MSGNAASDCTLAEHSTARIVVGAVIGLMGALIVLFWSPAQQFRDFVLGPGSLWAMCWALLAAIAGAGIGWFPWRAFRSYLRNGPRWVLLILLLLCGPVLFGAVVGNRSGTYQWALVISVPVLALLLHLMYLVWRAVELRTPVRFALSVEFGRDLFILVLVCGPSILGAIMGDTRAPVSETLDDETYARKYGSLFSVCVLATLAFLLRLMRLERQAEAIGPSVRTDPKLVDEREKRARAETIRTLTELARELRGCLLGLGMLLTFLILSQATLRLALNEFNRTHLLRAVLLPEPISLPQVLSYSLYYSFVILVIYTPFHIRLANRAREVVEAMYPLTAGQPHDVLKQRDDALRLIGLSGDWPEVLRSGVLVFSPLLATILSQALPK